MAATASTTWTFFPLWPVVDGVCTCSEGASCNRAGKHPSIAWGDLAPGSQIAGPEGAGRGLVTGAKSGVFVLDVDVSKGKDGLGELAKLGPIPATYTVETPTGGRHFYFAHPGRRVLTSGGALGPGLDIRGDGGFVVGPGSRHANGGTYRVLDSSPIAQAPEWLLAWPGLYGVERSTTGTGPRTIGPTHKLWAERNMMADAACRTYAPSQGGGEASAHLGRIVKRLVWDLELPADVALEKIATLWDPRCTKEDGFTPWPWGAAEIERAIANTMTRDFASGVAPAGWLDTFTAELSKPTPAPRVARRKHSTPGHRYTCSLGDVPNGDKATTDVANVISILVGHEDWAGVLQYDEFRDRVIAVDPPIQLEAERTSLTDTDITAIRTWFSCVGGLAISKDAAWDAVLAAAHKNKFHPVREYLADCRAAHPDPGEALDELATEGLGVHDALSKKYVRKFMIAAVRRVLRPGEQVDNVLVLFGAQGYEKTSFVRGLFGQDWTLEDPDNIADSKQVEEKLRGKWVCELAELHALLRAGDETAKSFVTRCQGTYRPAYGRSTVDRKRETVFIGTTNADDFLRDSTGNRRYWILRIDRPTNRAWLAANRDRVWAAAYAISLTDEKHWLTKEEETESAERAREFEEVDPWEDKILENCIGREHVTTAEVFQGLGGELERLDKRVQMRIAKSLKRLGCVKSLVPANRLERRGWRIPPEIATAPKKAKEFK